jgi:hypothetical protein
MSTLRVFKATLPSVNYIFKNGKPAIFVNGMYTTDVPFEIEELDAEIATRHPHIFIDESMREIDSAKVDPIAALREKIIAEYQATMAAATAQDNDLGTSTQGALKPASSVDIAAASAGGSGAGLAARILKSSSH